MNQFRSFAFDKFRTPNIHKSCPRRAISLIYIYVSACLDRPKSIHPPKSHTSRAKDVLCITANFHTSNLKRRPYIGECVSDHRQTPNILLMSPCAGHSNGPIFFGGGFFPLHSSGLVPNKLEVSVDEKKKNTRFVAGDSHHAILRLTGHSAFA